MKKTILVVAGVYVAGVVFDTVMYARQNNQTYGQVLSTPHPWIWPYLVITGAISKISPPAP